MRKKTKSTSLPEAATPAPSPAQAAPPPTRLKRRWGLYAALPLCGVPLAFLLGRGTIPHSTRPAAHPVRDAVVVTRKGPWGELERTPITISAPVELLYVRKVEEAGVHWFFPGLSGGALSNLMVKFEVPASAREQLLKPSTVQADATGAVLSPPGELLFNLSPKARLGLYRLLFSIPETRATLDYIPIKRFDETFWGSGVSPETLARFRRLGCPYGHLLIFAGLPGMLATIPTYEEKASLMKAITGQRTLLARLHITPASDISALVAYWDKAAWSTDVRAILQSLTRVPGGAYVDVVELLPPMPSSLLYTYPVPPTPLEDSARARDCHWTSFNFFNTPPDDRYLDPAYISQSFKLDYSPISAEPHFGDLVALMRPNGGGIHTAVFLADDIVFTKNGFDSRHPWMLSTIADMIDQFGFELLEGQQFTVRFYRNKKF